MNAATSLSRTPDRIALERSFLPLMRVDFLPVEYIEMVAAPLPADYVEELSVEHIEMIDCQRGTEAADFFYPNGDKIPASEFFTRDDMIALVANQ